jgi:hypothetical protein
LETCSKKVGFFMSLFVCFCLYPPPRESSDHRERAHRSQWTRTAIWAVLSYKAHKDQPTSGSEVPACYCARPRIPHVKKKAVESPPKNYPVGRSTWWRRAASPDRTPAAACCISGCTSCPWSRWWVRSWWIDCTIDIVSRFIGDRKPVTAVRELAFYRRSDCRGGVKQNREKTGFKVTATVVVDCRGGAAEAVLCPRLAYVCMVLSV